MNDNKQFPVWEVSEIAERESWRKEVNRPIYHIHKWWAQRLGSVFRAVLLYLIEDSTENIWDSYYKVHDYNNITVLDPFMGSGTTIGEALKLGTKAVGCDINPISSFLVRQELAKVSIDELSEAFNSLEKNVSPDILKCYQTIDDFSGELIPVLYYFWVKIVVTPDGEEIPLFSKYVFAQNAYASKKPKAQIICPECWKVFEGVYNQTNAVCPHCGKTFNPQNGPASKTTVRSTKGKIYKIKDLVPADGSLLKEKMYALLAVNKNGEKHYQSIKKYDVDLFQDICEQVRHSSTFSPSYNVRPGFNTDQARGYNYNTWRDFFNKRQLYCLGKLLDGIQNIKSQKIREQFLCLFSSTLEFNNMFCSYKGEGTGAVRPIFSNHILKPERTPLENSVWGYSCSSGCFSTLYKTRLLKAKQYLDNPFELYIDPETKKCSKRIASRKIAATICESWNDFDITNNAALILNGDSANLPIPDESVDFVVTDPPYFDFIHYSELSDFFYAWLGPLLKDTYSFFGGDTSRRDNEVQQTDARAFSMLLGGVFKESNRVLKPNGRLAFSFHHSRVEGWIAIYNAIKSAGLFVIDTFPIHAELMASTPKNSAKDPISLDAIIICGKTAPIIRDTVDTTRAIIDFLNIMSEHGKKLSSADVFVICCSQCLQKCIAENMDEDEVCSYIKKTFKELLLLWKNSENNMGR